jgi:TonB family protein
VFSQARLSDGAAIIPPKLIKSVRAIASPNALQYFDKGNTATVTLDAAVDSSGHVKSTKVLSGPASLRSAAMDALKQYRYEPAKLRGKPVAAHVTVKVEFLFEP